MIKIDCKKYADEILESVRNQQISKSLLILTAGDDPASAAYVKGKMKDCERCGIPVNQIRVDNEYDLGWEIGKANMNDDVGGIIVQLPLPEGFDEEWCLEQVSSKKDVDGFTQNSPFLPCTPEGILYILEKEFPEGLSGKNVLLIGKGKLVGKPLINLLLDRGCTLTIAHSKTKGLNGILTNYHDIVITGVGKPKLVNLRWVSAKVVIDAGINRDAEGKLCGDCFGFNPDDGFTMRVTTVPKGIGLMTRAMLMKHMGEC